MNLDKCRCSKFNIKFRESNAIMKFDMKGLSFGKLKTIYVIYLVKKLTRKEKIAIKAHNQTSNLAEN